MQRQQQIVILAVQPQLTVRADEDVPVLDVQRLLLIQTPIVRHAAVFLCEQPAGAILVFKQRAGDALVIFDDQLLHRVELLARLKLIAAVGDEVAAVDVGLHIERECLVAGPECRCLNFRSSRQAHPPAASAPAPVPVSFSHRSLHSKHFVFHVHFLTV